MSGTPKIRGIKMPVSRCIEFCRDYREVISKIKATGKTPTIDEHDIEFIELVGRYLEDMSDLAVHTEKCQGCRRPNGVDHFHDCMAISGSVSPLNEGGE